MLIKAQLNYCPLLWMLQSCKLNNKIKRLCKRCFCIEYNNNLNTFDEFIELDSSISIHHRILQCLAIEFYKTFNSISPDIMKDIFKLNTPSIYDITNG